MANAIDFIRASAEFLVEDRPDLYDQRTAVNEISQSMEDLRGTGKLVAFVTFSSYVLSRIYDVEEASEEFILSRKLAGLLSCLPEADVRAYAYDGNVNLPHILSPELDAD